MHSVHCTQLCPSSKFMIPAILFYETQKFKNSSAHLVTVFLQTTTLYLNSIVWKNYILIVIFLKELLEKYNEKCIVFLTLHTSTILNIHHWQSRKKNSPKNCKKIHPTMQKLISNKKHYYSVKKQYYLPKHVFPFCFLFPFCFSQSASRIPPLRLIWFFQKNQWRSGERGKRTEKIICSTFLLREKIVNNLWKKLEKFRLNGTKHGTGDEWNRVTWKIWSCAKNSEKRKFPTRKLASRECVGCFCIFSFEIISRKITQIYRPNFTIQMVIVIKF